MYFGYWLLCGMILFFGYDFLNFIWNEFFEIRWWIGVVFQDFCFLDYLIVFDNVILFLCIVGYEYSEYGFDVVEFLIWVGFGDRFYVKFLILLGGEKQRVVIVWVVIGKLDLLLVDEFMGNVDFEIGIWIMCFFLEFNCMGICVVIVMYDI